MDAVAAAGLIAITAAGNLIAGNQAAVRGGDVDREEGIAEAVVLDAAVVRPRDVQRGAIFTIGEAGIGEFEALDGDAIGAQDHNLVLAFAVEDRSRLAAQRQATGDDNGRLAVASRLHHDRGTRCGRLHRRRHGVKRPGRRDHQRLLQHGEQRERDHVSCSPPGGPGSLPRA